MEAANAARGESFTERPRKDADSRKSASKECDAGRRSAITRVVGRAVVAVRHAVVVAVAMAVPARRFVVIASAVVDPARGRIHVTRALAHPVAADPDVAMAAPIPISRGPDVPHARRGHDL